MNQRRQRMAMWIMIAALVASLLVGLLVPMERLQGKGWAARAVGYPLSAMVMGIIWFCKGRKEKFPYVPTGLLVTPFVLDLLGNLFGWFDNIRNFDDGLHFVNWMFLCAAFVAMIHPGVAASWNRIALGTGFGASAIILWELLEYLIMKSGTSGLHLTYEDTVSDLLLSFLGGLVGSFVIDRIVTKKSRS
jgi:hypothetical protein